MYEIEAITRTKLTSFRLKSEWFPDDLLSILKSAYPDLIFKVLLIESKIEDVTKQF
jgi:hypothetical protein